MDDLHFDKSFNETVALDDLWSLCPRSYPGRPGLLGHYRENRVNFYRIVRVLLCAYVVSRRTLIVFKSNSERLIIRIKYLYGSGIYTEFQI